MKGQDGVDLVQDIRVVVYMETQSCCLIPPTFSIATYTQRPAYAHFHPVSGIWHPFIKYAHLFQPLIRPCPNVHSLCVEDGEGACE